MIRVMLAFPRAISRIVDNRLSDNVHSSAMSLYRNQKFLHAAIESPAHILARYVVAADPNPVSNASNAGIGSVHKGKSNLAFEAQSMGAFDDPSYRPARERRFDQQALGTLQGFLYPLDKLPASGSGDRLRTLRANLGGDLISPKIEPVPASEVRIRKGGLSCAVWTTNDKKPL
ncbi:hypothetical protein Pla123a_24390 [Posidoniimonas polymericola]|uniref:Uncharacterized protein n=1 Tax=Posidoniimonas polymericola TaxID=2528002 RepID=A0A5C5YPX3_9BACT|nr:hypothetical protein [Posidoniimonas polymericola]TWT77012.1 hypothetical protein Pla123a_24390 [Posidoniimonas polymericola]